jgi:flagellin
VDEHRPAGRRAGHDRRHEATGVRSKLEIMEDLPMALRVNTNVEAFNAHRNLSATAMYLSKSMEKLSSGLRINRAADDAAGLSISEGMRAQIRGTAQASRNAQDGVSLVQTAEGALNEMHSILQRVRELSIQWGNGTLSTTDQAKVTAEVAQLTAELVRIRDSSTFNGIALFGASGAGTTVTLQVGANQNIDSATNTNRVGITVAALSFTGVSMDVSQIDTAISSVSAVRSTLGAVQNRLEAAVRNLGVSQENLSAAESRIRDVDVAQEMVNFTRLQILSESGTAMLAQANQSPQSVLSLLR